MGFFSGLFKKEKLEFDMVVTRGGDRGQSSLYSGERLYKDSLEFEVLGDLDELNSFIGIAKNNNPVPYHELKTIQQWIIKVSSLIATQPSSEMYPNYDVGLLTAELEGWIKRILLSTKIPTHFVTPGDSGNPPTMVAEIDVCRSICRRAERHIVRLINQNNRPDLFDTQVFLNRLSDYFYSLARSLENT